MGTSAQVVRRVLPALYAGITTTTFFPRITESMIQRLAAKGKPPGPPVAGAPSGARYFWKCW